MTRACLAIKGCDLGDIANKIDHQEGLTPRKRAVLFEGLTVVPDDSTLKEAIEALDADAVDNVKQASAIFSGFVRHTGICSATPASNQNDWSPTGFDDCSIFRIAPATAINITGIVPAYDGQLVYVFNTGSFTATLKNNDAASAAGNRFAFDADVSLAPGTGVTIWNDWVSARWRKAALAAGSGGAGMTADTGWTAFSGTADKASSLDTEAITIRNLARRVKAIQDTLALNLRPNA